MSDDGFKSLDQRGDHDEVYRNLLDAAPDAVIVVDAGGRIVLANTQSERLFGYDRRALLGREVEILVPERLRTAHFTHRRAFSDAPKVRPMGSGLELFGRRQDGSEFPIEISLSPLQTKDGVLVSASIRDITDRKRSEREMRRVQEHLLSAVESIQGAFAIFDVEDRLLLCNSAYMELFGRNVRDSAVGKTYTDLLDTALRSDLFDPGEASDSELRSKVLANHENPQHAVNVRTRDGHDLRIVERRTAEAGTLMTIWDVTQEVEHEAELRSARALAEAASSAKSEFLASMSHELRTPLNAILGFAQLLHRDKKTPLSDRHRERVEHVLKGGEHLLRLIDEVLDLSRIEAGRVLVSPEPLDVGEVLAEVKLTLDSMAARGAITLLVEPVVSDCTTGVADRTRFKQILMNLGSNAIKYGREGGSATFRTARSGDAIRVTLIDDGIGIPESKQDKIFQPFQRAGQETGPIEGTGIGLAITKRLAELMDGSVGFESKEGVGSSFWVEIPAHRADASSSSLSRPSTLTKSRLASLEGERIVVVYIEDNPSNIAFMEALLADFEGVELVAAPTAEIGLELVRARRPDVVIMDINLPGMNGFEATRQLQSWPETRDIPVVALSAAAMVRDQARIEAAGFHRYLTKPVDVDELTSVLEELLT